MSAYLYIYSDNLDIKLKFPAYVTSFQDNSKDDTTRFKPFQLAIGDSIFYSNGYIKFCNQHRYLHQTKEKQNEIDHFFVAKTANEIIDEKIFSLNFNLYVDYTRKLAQEIRNEFDLMIQRNYQEHLVAQTQFVELSQWLQTHTLDFREKRPTYQDEQVFVKTWGREQISPILVKTE